jgi:hypothetical protein
MDNNNTIIKKFFYKLQVIIKYASKGYLIRYIGNNKFQFIKK